MLGNFVAAFERTVMMGYFSLMLPDPLPNFCMGKRSEDYTQVFVDFARNVGEAYQIIVERFTCRMLRLPNVG